MLCHFLHIMLFILFILKTDDSILRCSESAHSVLTLHNFLSHFFTGINILLLLKQVK